MNTIKNIRQMIDAGLITPEETRGSIIKIGFLFFTITGYEETPGDFLPNKWFLEREGLNYEFVPYNGLQRI